MEKLYEKLKAEYFIIAGPCVVESEEIVMEIASTCKQICEELGVNYIFKASFDKANRTTAEAFRGLGLKNALNILEKVKKTYSVPVTTDIHESYQAEIVKDIVDIIQIPAFLARQTDLILAAAETGNIVNVKKAQFLSGKDMRYPMQKIINAGNNKVILTERGSMYGYNNLVVDFRNLYDMKEFGIPVVMDVTHSVQRPGQYGANSGGESKYAPFMAYAAATFGVSGHFFEVHPNPENALSDGANMIKLSEFKKIIQNILNIKKAID